MKKAHLLVALCILSGCTHDHDADTAPVRVDTPGMPSAELALQQSIDRVHGFITNMQQRLGDDPALRILPGSARSTVATATRPSATANNPPTSGTPPATPAASSHGAINATPLIGKGGITWFAFGDGRPTVTCQYPAICLVRLELGETAQASQITLSDTEHWHTDLVRGTHGIHAGWALAIEPGPEAREAQISLPTSRRTYNIQLVASTPSMTSIAFTHAPNDPLSQPPFAPASPLAAYGRSNPDFRYTLSGATPPWTPLRVYRDAGHTFIDFPQGQIVHRPQLVILAPHIAQANAYHVAGDSYVSMPSSTTFSW
ncbi:TrbG/VirB9 family P-type conjugative transfer protein [Acetobacter okinawensis]|uniref:TrbG/VirB9 family P-type conjugative transfer protein n=1 Tax=Acetobacter okinawensis TaxID=1076594 RepID=UPI0004722A12|nr:TrbG/VirB9 family P-type conjugative transfer protein [Acetobacter okinawensis]